jgi:hypothetical protein
MTKTTGSTIGTTEVVVDNSKATTENSTTNSMADYPGPASVEPIVDSFIIKLPIEVKLAVNSVNISQHRNSKPDAETWALDKLMKAITPAFEKIADGLAEVERLGYQQNIKKGFKMDLSEADYVARETKAVQEQLAVIQKLAKQYAKA